MKQINLTKKHLSTEGVQIIISDVPEPATLTAEVEYCAGQADTLFDALLESLPPHTFYALARRVEGKLKEHKERVEEQLRNIMPRSKK